jgi:hypothetical protein
MSGRRRLAEAQAEMKHIYVKHSGEKEECPQSHVKRKDNIHYTMMMPYHNTHRTHKDT